MLSENSIVSKGLKDPTLTPDNFDFTVLKFRDRQAGVGVVFDPNSGLYSYNAYCIETTLMQELFTVECEDLDKALDLVNAEFGHWEKFDLSKKEGCGSCAAK